MGGRRTVLLDGPEPHGVGARVVGSLGDSVPLFGINVGEILVHVYNLDSREAETIEDFVGYVLGAVIAVHLSKVSLLCKIVSIRS